MKESANTEEHLATPSDLWSKEVEMSGGQLLLRCHSPFSTMFENYT